MKALIGIIVIGLLAIGGYTLWAPGSSMEEAMSATAEDSMMADAQAVTEGEYTILANESTVRWAGKKPLIEGYVNTGSFSLSEGTIDVVSPEEATGTFTINMETLSVTATPKKPGQESALEGHLKGERWFDAAQYPTATFEITQVTPETSEEKKFAYSVVGNLTLKGQTHEVTFPATIYQDADGLLHATASFEIDRTQWGITSGSASFFDNMADNAIDDMVALSFEIVAQKN